MTHLLLDTHALLWWVMDDARLGEAARARIADTRTRVHVSVASGWEIAIKRASGKLRAPSDVGTLIADEGFDRLSISFEHAERAAALPLLHRDPFDRMLIAQSRMEELDLVTVDSDIRRYDVSTVDASR